MNKQRKQKKLATLTEEDWFWIVAFHYYLNDGQSPQNAGKKTWKEMCNQFPRLKKYDGAK